MYRPVVTICTAQWSLYVPDSGPYMYSTVVTICTAPWSLYVPPSGHYMYRPVVTTCTGQWSLYVQPVVTIHVCTASLTFNNCTFCPHTVFMCFMWIWEQTAIISLYIIDWLVFITETECLLRGTFYILRSAHTVCLCVLCGSENKQPLFHCTALTDWFLWPRRSVFTARYGLNL